MKENITVLSYPKGLSIKYGMFAAGDMGYESVQMVWSGEDVDGICDGSIHCRGTESELFVLNSDWWRSVYTHSHSSCILK